MNKTKKRAIMGMVVASAVATTALTASVAGAAPAVKIAAASASVQNASVTIDGIKVSLPSIVANGSTLVSVHDAADVLGALFTVENGTIVLINENNRLELKAGSMALNVNGQQDSFQVAPQETGRQTYAELDKLVEALGGEVTEDSGDKAYVSVKPFSGPVSNPRWFGSNIIVSKANDNGDSIDYKISTYSKTSQQLSAEDAYPAVVSPNGKYGIYTNSKNEVFLQTIATGAVTKISGDTEIKNEFVWSADSSKVFFLLTDKGTTIASIDPFTGAIKKVVDDKVEYKSDLHVSADGKKFTYLVTTAVSAKVDSKADIDKDAVEIDFSNATSQVMTFDTTQKDAKAVALTKTKDNKSFLNVLPDGKVVFVSVDLEAKDAKALLKAIGTDGSVTDLAADLDVTFSTLTADGKPAVVAADVSGKSNLYVIDPATNGKTSVYAADDIQEAAFAHDGKIAVISDDQLVIVGNGKTVQLTK